MISAENVGLFSSITVTLLLIWRCIFIYLALKGGLDLAELRQSL